MPDFYIETSYKQPVIGIDEVGRGPLAGPVVSCACIFFDYFIPLEELQEINDSKKLSPIKRKKALYTLTFLSSNETKDLFSPLGNIYKLNRIQTIGGKNAKRDDYQELIITNIK